MRILSVEDDRDLNRQLEQAFADAGYVVDKALDGEEGHFLGDTEPYDAVVLDIGLPKMDGITVLEAIRAFEEANGVALNYTIGPRRPGDVVAIYANKDKAERALGWKPHFSLKDIMETAWKWEKQLQDDEALFNAQNPRLN